MSLLDTINKLITEHGSATILRTHLDLIRDQASALEKENATLKTRLAEAEYKCNEQCKVIAASTAELDSIKHCDIKYKIKWGCLVFEGDENLYCPACFFKNKTKIPTSRKNTSYRYCSVCRSDIPAG